MNQLRSISITSGGIIKTFPVKELIPTKIQNSGTLTSPLENELDPTCEIITNSVLSVNLPPSVPIMYKPGALVSIYGLKNKSISSISNSSSWNFRSLVYGDFNILYTKILLTTSMSMLILSNKRNWLKPTKATSNNSISALQLDGTTDWALLKPRNLHLLIGNSLIVKNYIKPKNVLKRFARFFKLPSHTFTGLRTFLDWFKFTWGYKLVSGRGIIGVIGQGSIYDINLTEGEEILINKANLLAISVNGSNDLQNCLVKYEDPVDVVPVNEIVNNKPPTSISTSSKIFGKLKLWGIEIGATLGILQRKVSNYVIGNQEFIKIIGPRKVLIQSESGYRLPALPIDSINQNLKQFKLKANDYLNVVNLTSPSPNKIRSTPKLINDISSPQK